MHSGFTPGCGGFGGDALSGHRVQFLVSQPFKAQPVTVHRTFLKHFHRHKVGAGQRGIAEDLRQHVGVVRHVQLFAVLLVTFVTAEHRFCCDQFGFGHASTASNDFLRGREGNPDKIKPEHIRRYMDQRGMASKTQANREKSFLSRVFRWGYERGYVQHNPCQGVKKFKEAARERYITDEEYKAVYDVAPDVVRATMEIAYLCLARQSDVLALTEDQIRETGIFIRQGKTGVKQIKAWSPRLRAAVALARSLPLKPGIRSLFVIHQTSGSKYTRDGFNSRWRDAKIAAQEKNPHLQIDFTFHDLKAKGVSDLEGSLEEKQAISGHKNSRQTAIYDRKTKIVPVVGGQKK